MPARASLDLDAVRELIAELGLTLPLNFVLRDGPFVEKCSCPDPTHKGRTFVGFHSVRDGEHRIEVDATKSRARVNEILLHEIGHAVQWEQGQREAHDNSLPYREDPRELDAASFAADALRRGVRLVGLG